MSPGVKPQRRPDFKAKESALRALVPVRIMSTLEMPAWRSDAERACAYVIAKVQASSGPLFHQGARVPALGTASTSPVVRFIAERRMHRVSTAVARALVAWADGFPVELLTDVPPARRVLALQAAGRRCVSLLPEGVATHPHADALAFAVHDLCHLDKFIDVEHHRGQVGFFSCLDRAVGDSTWAPFENTFDAAFSLDWQHVAADMNGSAVFLFAALKMKLKMGVRRLVAAKEGRPSNEGGVLTASESRAYGAFLENLLSLLSLHGDVAEAARRTSARRDDPGAAYMLLRYFEEVGDAMLRGRSATQSPENIARSPVCSS